MNKRKAKTTVNKKKKKVKRGEVSIVQDGNAVTNIRTTFASFILRDNVLPRSITDGETIRIITPNDDIKLNVDKDGKLKVISKKMHIGDSKTVHIDGLTITKTNDSRVIIEKKKVNLFSAQNISIGEHIKIGNGASDLDFLGLLGVPYLMKPKPLDFARLQEFNVTDSEEEEIQERIETVRRNSPRIPSDPVKREQKCPEDEDDYDKVCCICSERYICTKILDCKHEIMCITCSRKILLGEESQRKCPICRKEIKKGIIKK